MNEHDEELDRVLRALGAAEPVAGMEGRVLARLAQPVAAKKWQGRWMWAACAGLGCALLAQVFVLPARQPGAAPLTRAAGPQAEAKSVPPLTRVAPLQVRSAPYAVFANTPTSLVAAQTAELHPDRGLADLPSMLAPPAPLTEQEHQLAEIARGPERQALPMLKASERERMEEQSAAEFKQFFPPPTPQEIYLATHLDN